MREIGRNEAGGSRRSPILWMGINRGRLPDGRKGMQRTRKIEDVMKNYTGTREVLQYRIGDYLPGRSGRGEAVGSRRKLTRGERRSENGMKFFKVGGLAELRTNSPWLCLVESVAETQKSENSGVA